MAIMKFSPEELPAQQSSMAVLKMEVAITPHRKKFKVAEVRVM